MDLAHALEIVITRTGVRRYAELCDPAHPAYVAEYVPLVRDMAARIVAGTWPGPAAGPRPSAAGHTPFPDSYLRVMECDYRDQPDTSRDRGCGCADARACGLGKGMVNLADCLQCVKG